MELSTIMNFLELAVMLILGFLSLYLKQKNDIIDMAKDKIAEAENEYRDMTDMGGQKFEWVVESIYKAIPLKFRPFCTKESIGVMVQRVFDGME